MRQRIANRWGIWVGVAATVAVAAGSRLASFALGKALAFGYAVIVSIAANFAIDFVRTPADELLHTALLRSPAPDVAAARAAAPLPAPPARPGPGSGGLY
ncbi:MAG TPA: hypothetical protein VGF34_08285 [Stellaceae bacterium]|jgi:hypothetical protein